MATRLLRFVWFCAVLVYFPSIATAEVISEWNTLALDAIRNESTSPPLAARNLAIFHAAIFDAVNSIERTCEPYLFPQTSPNGASPEAAAVGAAYECLSHLFPSQSASFEVAFDRFLNNRAATPSRADGLIIGEVTALLFLAWRSADGSSTTVPYIPGTDPGDWRRTPPFFRPPELPQWPYVEPFGMTNGTQFRPLGPPLLISSQYAADVNQVKQSGAFNSTNRSVEQTLIARFWSDFSYTVTPPGHWNQIAQNVATNRASTLSQNARLFALLNIAMADVGIVVWDAKYLYNFWRPITAIHEADTDGNIDTEGDSNWVPLLNTPPFPEYPSGHSTFSAAAAAVLAGFYGTDHISFTVGSDTLAGVFRTYNSFESAAEEIGLSRIYGGIHFLSADLDGLKAGRNLGEYILQNYLRPIPERAVLSIHPNLISARPRIVVAGHSGGNYIVETSTDLLQWTPVTTNTVPFTFDDSTASDHARFYRAVSAP